MACIVIVSFPSARGYGAEVAFKKWGKIEARGNTLMLPAGLTLLTERVIGLFAPLANAAGAFIYRLTRDNRWSYLEQALLERFARWLHQKKPANSGSRPDFFLLEVYNPMDAPGTDATEHVDCKRKRASGIPRCFRTHSGHPLFYPLVTRVMSSGASSFQGYGMRSSVRHRYYSGR